MGEEQMSTLGLSCLVAVLLRSGRRCLFLSGWGFEARRLEAALDDSPLREVPRFLSGAGAGAGGRCWLFVAKAAAHERVLPLCAAAIYHGSAGTLARCLEAGVPVVIVPVLPWSDQPFFGERMEELGAGRLVEYRTSPADGGACGGVDLGLASRVAAALQELLTAGPGGAADAAAALGAQLSPAAADRAVRTLEFNLLSDEVEPAARLGLWRCLTERLAWLRRHPYHRLVLGLLCVVGVCCLGSCSMDLSICLSVRFRMASV